MTKYKRFSFILPYVVFALIVCSGIVMSYEVHKAVKKEMHHNITYLANDMSGRILSRMGTYEQVLKGIAGHYVSNDYQVTRQSLVKYASELGIELNLPGVQAVGFSSYVSHKNVEAHIINAIGDGYPYYRLKTDKPKVGYLMVDIMYPDNEENRRVYGFDLTSEPIRAEMLSYAVKTKHTGLTGKLVLKQELSGKDAPAGVLMSKPLYKDGSLFGVISAPFRINDLMNGIFEGDTKKLVMKIYDGKIDDETLMFVTDNKNEAINGDSCEVVIEMYGRKWVVVYEPTERYMSQFDFSKPYMIMISMFIIGVLLMLLFRNILTQRDKTYVLAKQMAEQLGESEHKFHQIFEQASAGIVITGLELNVISCNRSFTEILDYSDMEIVEIRLTDLIDKEEIEEVAEGISLLKDRVIDAYKTEKVMQKRDGSSVWVEFNASIFYDKNVTAKYIIFIIQDISRRKEAEKSLLDVSMQQSAILNNSLIGIMKVRARKIEWINKAYEEMFGYSDAELEGKSTRVLHPSEEEYLRFGREVDNYEKMLHDGFVQTEVEMLKKDGTTIWVDISGKLISNDVTSSSIWVINDVTEKKKAQDGLIYLNINLESRVVEETQRRIEQERLFMQQGRMAAMGEMIGAIAHQWRQPLNIVALIVQNICADFDDGILTKEDMNGYTESVIGQLQHMSTTIDDFRNFFIVDKRNAEFEPCRQIAAVLQLVNAQMKANNISINLIRGRSAMACGVPNEFSQVMLNLISNSKDAFIANEVVAPMIEITIDYEEPNIIVKLRDNAGGIADEIAGKVFDPYFTTKKKELGTGIGLYMSKMIINDHFGGSLSFENKGGGVEFMISIPGHPLD